MKKVTAILMTFAVGGYAQADEFNPFFIGHRHQIGFSVGTGVNSGVIVPPPIQFVPFTEYHFQYSVPSDMFYFPARFSFNITQTVGYAKSRGWNWPHYSIPIGYLTKDIAFLYGRNWYAGLGGGGGFQAKENERIGSKLVFTFKLFAGYRLNDKTAIEAYIKHFSNGNTAPENNSYAFYGLGITYNF
jgi:hypothetical protein